MKEVKKWDNKPHEMWVWDDEKSLRFRRKVIYVFENVAFPVVVVSETGRDVAYYKHCAEIEQSLRLMTNKELSRWLREKPDREWKCSAFIHADLIYRESEEDEPVRNDIRVREGDGAWFVPFTEGE